MESQGRWELGSVDIAANTQVPGRLGVIGLPTVVGFARGTQVATVGGARTQASLRQFVAEVTSHA